MPRTAPIARRSLSEELAEHLRDLIISGDLAAGGKIDEPELCARFAVSRTPLREAIKIVATEGLVTLTPNRGARVATITAAEIAELFPIMGALEGLAGELAIARLTDKSLARLEALHADICAARKASNWLAYAKANRGFHELIFTIAANTALHQTYQQLMVRIHAVRFVARQPADAWDQAVADHEDIMGALRARRTKDLGRLLRRHLDHKARSVIAAMAV
jgi:DNA-binding GntR family transcriptional regulator